MQEKIILRNKAKHGKFLHRKERALQADRTEVAKAWERDSARSACESLKQSGVGSMWAMERL